MKKNYYGNIEDILQNVKVVTSKVFKLQDINANRAPTPS
jgi:hypothetical protein